MNQHHRTHATLTHAGPGKPTTLSNTAVASSATDHHGRLAWYEDIRLCAYQKWEAAGRPTGDGIQFWLEAEQELVKRKKEKFDQGDGRHEDREFERHEAGKKIKEDNAHLDIHYRDNNRMFQNHGDRGHRHGLKRG